MMDAPPPFLAEFLAPISRSSFLVRLGRSNATDNVELSKPVDFDLVVENEYGPAQKRTLCFFLPSGQTARL